MDVEKIYNFDGDPCYLMSCGKKNLIFLIKGKGENESMNISTISGDSLSLLGSEKIVWKENHGVEMHVKYVYKYLDFKKFHKLQQTYNNAIKKSGVKE